MSDTQIAIESEIRDELRRRKVAAETYSDVLRRLLDETEAEAETETETAD